jgi:hypothetical protein
MARLYCIRYYDEITGKNDEMHDDLGIVFDDLGNPTEQSAYAGVFSAEWLNRLVYLLSFHDGISHFISHHCMLKPKKHHL